MRQLCLSLLFVASTAQSAAPTEFAIGAAEALLRYEAPTLTSDISDICITVGGSEASPEFLTRIKDLGLRIRSCGNGIMLRIPFGEPSLQPNGDYNVVYGHYLNCKDCGLQGEVLFATMRRGKSGWHVVEVRGGVKF